MLAGAGANMDLVSEHFYCQESPGLMAHVAQIPNQIRRITDAVRKSRQTIPALARQDLRIAMDEWNYWYGPHLYGELGTRYFLKDALGIAAGFNEYARQSDIVFMANYAQTVNVIGAIKTTKTAAALDATGVVLKLYRQHFGAIPVEVARAVNEALPDEPALQPVKRVSAPEKTDRTPDNGRPCGEYDRETQSWCQPASIDLPERSPHSTEMKRLKKGGSGLM